MPWKDKGLMSLREEFVHRAKSENIAQLCREYKISRKTGHKWLSRYEEEGILGLQDRSRRPFQSSSKVDKEHVELILASREKYPAWGAKKLRQVLLNEGHKDLPSLSSFNRILTKAEKIPPLASEKRKHFIRFERSTPNELWQMDFKGYFQVKEGECHPLTILDDCSRYSICLKACSTENEINVREGLEMAFQEYGLPEAMTMDNGSPWKGYPTQRLSNITVWLMRLGIRVSHSRPNHPQTQGKDERFHRSLKEELLKYHNFQDLEDAQRHFNEWRDIYNHIRPHEALGMDFPAKRYKRSERKFPKKLPQIEYEKGDEVKKVGNNGEICFRGKRQYVGSHLRGDYVALRFRRDEVWDIYYVKSRIGGINLK